MQVSSKDPLTKRLSFKCCDPFPFLRDALSFNLLQLVLSSFRGFRGGRSPSPFYGGEHCLVLRLLLHHLCPQPSGSHVEQHAFFLWQTSLLIEAFGTQAPSFFWQESKHADFLKKAGPSKLGHVQSPPARRDFCPNSAPTDATQMPIARMVILSIMFCCCYL